LTLKKFRLDTTIDASPLNLEAQIGVDSAGFSLKHKRLFLMVLNGIVQSLVDQKPISHRPGHGQQFVASVQGVADSLGVGQVWASRLTLRGCP
jgi:hypothetical protein